MVRSHSQFYCAVKTSGGGSFIKSAFHQYLTSSAEPRITSLTGHSGRAKSWPVNEKYMQAHRVFMRALIKSSQGHGSQHWLCPVDKPDYSRARGRANREKEALVINYYET